MRTRLDMRTRARETFGKIGDEFFPQKIGPQILPQIGLNMRTRARVNFSAKKPHISPKKIFGEGTDS